MALTQFFSLMFPRNEVEIKKKNKKQKNKTSWDDSRQVKTSPYPKNKGDSVGKKSIRSAIYATFAGNSSNIRSQTSS